MNLAHAAAAKNIKNAAVKLNLIQVTCEHGVYLVAFATGDMPCFLFLTKK